MQHALYLDDSYLKNFTSKVISLEGEKHIILKHTTFYPTSGGQPHDVGTITSEGKIFQVTSVLKKGDQIIHDVSPNASLTVGAKVVGSIDWDRRYMLMRMHTAAHMLSQAIHEKTGALITGNQLGIEGSRIDFSLEQFDPDSLKSYVTYANSIIQQDLSISPTFSSDFSKFFDEIIKGCIKLIFNELYNVSMSK